MARQEKRNRVPVVVKSKKKEQIPLLEPLLHLRKRGFELKEVNDLLDILFAVGAYVVLFFALVFN